MIEQDWADNFPISTYFSYVTLTTLGYGDISPAAPVSRVLVYLEAISGTFYMAVVVASLVSAGKSDNKH
jgi:voltage-gated potassium channel